MPEEQQQLENKVLSKRYGLNGERELSAKGWCYLQLQSRSSHIRSPNVRTLLMRCDACDQGHFGCRIRWGRCFLFDPKVEPGWGAGQIKIAQILESDFSDFEFLYLSYLHDYCVKLCPNIPQRLFNFTKTFEMVKQSLKATWPVLLSFFLSYAAKCIAFETSHACCHFVVSYHICIPFLFFRG